MSGMEDAEGPHIATTSDERLVYMANQISRFFAAQGREAAVAGVRGHIASFWDPRMRARIRGHLAAGGEGLDPIARDAVAALDR
jgi:formate dehydrogenase subunit delta